MITCQAFRYLLRTQVKNKGTINVANRYVKCSIGQSFRFTHASQTEEEKDVLVYEAPLRRRLRITKIISLSSSVLGAAMLPSVLLDFSQVSVALACGAGLIASAFLSTPLVLHWLTRRYVLRLRYEPERRLFSATTFDLLARETERQFSAKDVVVPELPAILSSFEVQGRPLFVDARLVKDPDAYSHMMGYDKPLRLDND